MSGIELLEAREDGQCCKCKKYPAVTTDNMYCRKCFWNIMKLRSVWKKYMEESRRENAYKRGYAQGYEAALALLTHCYKHLHE